MKKLILIGFALLIAFSSVITASAQEDHSMDVKVGDTIYDYDENGNLVERVITAEGAIPEDEFEATRYMNYIGSGVATRTASQYVLVSLDEYNKKTQVSTHASYEDAVNAYEEAVSKNPRTNYGITNGSDTFYKIKYGTVIFKSILSDGYIKTLSYTEDKTGKSGYLNPVYGVDAAYLETKDNMVKFKMANVVGWIDETLVSIVPYGEKTNYISYYKYQDGAFYHSIKSTDTSANTGYSGSYIAGYVPSNITGLTNNEFYYSYDAHYFYKDYFYMIDDYRNETHDHALNSKPYYNYYEYLSHRTSTVFTADQINEFLNYKIGSKTSVMKNSGQYFIDSQNTYGANALLMLGVAVNESAWGTSSYAINRNNLFGHAAYDSNPDNASGYKNVGESIQYHAQYYVSKNYVSPTIYENGKVVLGMYYFSANLGNKGSGMNIRYASDPYWGEKNAITAYQLNNYFNKEDYGRYTIGVKNKIGTIDIKKESSSSSKTLYQTEIIKDVPFIILESVHGESINGNDLWYKVQSDAPLTSSRDSYTTSSNTYTYNMNNSYGYVHSSNIDIVFTGKNGIEESTPTYNHGDVNGDGQITSLDYIKIKNHIMETKILSGGELERADVNKDGSITSLDYIKIKNHIMGTNPLF